MAEEQGGKTMFAQSTITEITTAFPGVNRVNHAMHSGPVYWLGSFIGPLFMICLLAQTAWAYSGGMGSFQAPYLISGPADLIELGQNPKDYDRHFLLTADIDLSGYIFDVTDSYSLAFIVFAITAAVAVAIALVLRSIKAGV